MTNQTTDRELQVLGKSIDRANMVVIAWMAGWAIVYFIWFFLVKRSPLSDSSANWGTFGDFFGGVLNPVVAYSAFYWLTKSVRLQKEELSATRAALSESATAQNTQATLANVTVRLSALNSLSSSIMSEVTTQRNLLQFYVEQLRVVNRPVYNTDGNNIDIAALRAILAEINERIATRMTERYQYEQEIRSLLQSHTSAQPVQG